MALKLHYHLTFRQKNMNKFKDKNDYIDKSTIVDLAIFTILSFIFMFILFTLRNF